MLKKVELLMQNYVAAVDPFALKLYKKLSSGKRLRAKLILKIAPYSDDAVKLAAIIELIHVASLLHDDVIDDATTRRGSPSINTIYDSKTAVMLGDILYSKAFFELNTFSSPIAQKVSDAVTKLSAGELLDVTYSESLQFDQEKYFDMIYKKTAVLIEATAESAAYLAGKDHKLYSLYGKNLGLAFQIIDDVLDITADSKKLGKPTLADFKDGKTTLPYIYLYQALNDQDRQIVQKLYKKELNNDEKVWLITKMKESGAVLRSIETARRLGYEALEAIKEDQSEDLEKVIKDMIEREF